MLLLCYPKCSACKKAENWLDANGIAYEERDIKAQNPSAGELRAWIVKSKFPLKKFFNTSGNSYKNLGLKDKLPKMSDDEQIELLASDGMLVKRPLLITETRILIGFREAEWSEALKQR